MTSNYTHLTTISTSLQLSPPISNYLCPRATDPAAHYGPRTWALGGQEKKKEAGRGRNKKGRKGDAARQGENIYLIFSFYLPCLGPDYPEDPYYHGLSARVPVFGGSREKEMRGQGAPTRQAVSQGHWWQDRMYPSGELFLSFFNPHNLPT